jgi:hypothetical protein
VDLVQILQRGTVALRVVKKRSIFTVRVLGTVHTAYLSGDGALHLGLTFSITISRNLLSIDSKLEKEYSVSRKVPQGRQWGLRPTMECRSSLDVYST